MLVHSHLVNSELVTNICGHATCRSVHCWVRSLLGAQVSWADWGQTGLALVPRALLVGGAIVACGLALWVGAHMYNGGGA